MNEMQLDQFNLYVMLMLAFFVALVYLGVGIRVLREAPMNNSVTQFYGYSVCLVAVIAVLVATGGLAGAVVEWTDPLHAGEFLGFAQQRSLASFETYKMDILNPPFGGPQPTELRYAPDDETMRRMYEAARFDRIQSVRLRLRRSVVSNGLTVVFGVALFAVHWRWLRRLTKS